MPCFASSAAWNSSGEAGLPFCRGRRAGGRGRRRVGQSEWADAVRSADRFRKSENGRHLSAAGRSESRSGSLSAPALFLEAEVVPGRLEEMEIVVAGHVLVKGSARAFGVSHLAEHASVRGSDAFHGPDGAVGVEVHVHGGMAVEIHVLGGDLSVCPELFKQRRFAQEAAFAV